MPAEIFKEYTTFMIWSFIDVTEVTLPHALQWCLRLVNVNLASHCIQLGASASGSQCGATLPSCVIVIFILALARGGLIAPNAGGTPEGIPTYPSKVRVKRK